MRMLPLLLVLPAIALAQEPAPRVVDAKMMSMTETLWILLPVGRVTVFGTDSANMRYTIQEGTGVPLLGKLPYVGNLFSVRDPAFFPDTTALNRFPDYQGGYFQRFFSKTLMLSFPPPRAWTDGWKQSYAFKSNVVNLEHSYQGLHDPWDSTRKLPTLLARGTVLGNGRIDGFDGSALEVRVYVPRHFPKLHIQIPLSGMVMVQDFDGDLVIENSQGSVRLGHVGGSALVEAKEGDVIATFTNTTIDHPISLMSAKGNIQAWFGMGIGANVKMDLGKGKLLSDSYYFAKMMAVWGFPPSNEPITGNNLKWTVGKGGVSVSLNALQGDIRIESVKDLPRWPK